MAALLKPNEALLPALDDLTLISTGYREALVGLALGVVLAPN